MKKIPQSLISRAPKIISAALKIATNKDYDFSTEAIGELKGIPQKIGQLISIDATDFFPEDLKNKMSELQNKSKELDYDAIYNVLLNEIGFDKLESISNFSKKAIGNGSIGQVHTANFQNELVVFKIQYPSIAKTIENDLLLLVPIAQTIELFKPRSKDFSILIKESSDMLKSELDFSLERKRMDLFRTYLKDDLQFRIPKTFDELSNSKIICMEFVDAPTLNDFISNEKDYSKRLRTGKALLKLFINEFFDYKMVQTDPNFSNYLIEKDGTITLLDFGAVKEFESEFVYLYFQLLDAAINKKKEVVLKLGEKFGLVSLQDSNEVQDKFYDFITLAMSCFRKDFGEMNFKNEKLTKELSLRGWELWKKQRISAPNSNLLFLHRKLGGLFSILKKLELTFDLSEFWELIIIKAKPNEIKN